MLISPPFLLPPVANESDEAYVARCMNGDAPGDGAFPVSAQLAWHGGVHLTAPQGASGPEKVRAIADGKVVFKRDRTVTTDQTHPLYYDRGFTSDGCVVIEHETAIGASATDVATTMKFYSIYLHMHTIAVGPNQRVYRKDELGQAGNIAGAPNRIHFEIVGDDTCVQAMLGRPAGAAVGATGRTDAVFGDTYFLVPSGTAVWAESPQAAVRSYVVLAGDTPQSIASHFNVQVARLKTLNDQGSKTEAEFAEFITDKATASGAHRNISVPPPYAKAVAGVTSVVQVGTLKHDIMARVNYRAGQAHWTATLPDGKPLSQAAPVTVDEHDAEYDLYKDAADRYPNCASAGYEVMRFGRLIGPDALHPDDVDPQVNRHVHFRKMPCLLADGSVLAGFVDLKTPGVGVYSDADMPEWDRWKQVQDVTDNDSRCKSADVLALLDADGDGQLTAAEASTRLRDPEVQRALQRALVKAPTEWEKSSIDARWGWLQQDNPKHYAPLLSEPMTAGSFAKLKAFLELLCFWEQVQAATGLAAGHWHFEPREFIRHFRKSIWLSGNEMAQCIPRKCSLGTTPWATALSRGNAHHTRMSRMFTRYGADTAERKIHMLAQIYIETGMLRLMEEGGRGAPNAALPKTRYYAAFFGRGYMQLTWASNYDGYGRFRNFANHAGAYSDARITQTSTHVWTDFDPAREHANMRQWGPRYDPDIIVNDEFTCADSGGFYWVSKTYRGVSNMMRVADLGLTANIIGFCSWLVNGGSNGYLERQGFSRFLLDVLGDEPRRTGIEAWSYPPISPQLIGHFPPGSPPNTLTVQVPHDRQIP